MPAYYIIQLGENIAMLKFFRFGTMLMLFLSVMMAVLSSGCDSPVEKRTVDLAAWNVRLFSDKSRDRTEVKRIAEVLIDYDVVALVELRDEQVLKRTVRQLGMMGRQYEYLISSPVGRLMKERFAFLYDPRFVAVVGPVQAFDDDADGVDDFIRDPYVATFRAGSFDFTAIVVRVIWGKKEERQREIQKLADLYRRVQHSDANENDVILLGDFNRNPDDSRAFTPLQSIPSMTNLFNLPLTSHIEDTSLYDNIFFQKGHAAEYTGECGIDKFDETDWGNKNQAASQAVSDRRPVWARFWMHIDDD